MSIAGPQTPATVAATHAVQFYESDDYLCDVVAQHVADGLAADQPALVLATPAHAAGIRSRLALRGFGAGTPGLKVADAEETLALFTTGPMLDEAACVASIESLLDEACRGRGRGTTVRVFGEMVDLLWSSGRGVAALRLEEIWNEVSERYSIALICGYALDHFTRAEHSRAFLEICGHHARVLPPEGFADLDAEGRDRAVSRLQQRAHALEAEVERRALLERALRDALSERRRSEHELRAAKESADRANDAKTDFLAVMSHELRTPLNAILGYEDLLRHGVAGPLTDQQRQYLDRLRGSADQLLGLVNQVLQLSRVEAGQEELELDTVCLAAVVAEALQSVEPHVARKGLLLRVADDAPGLELHTDVGKLRQIILNLLSNAVKFTARGSVTLTLRAGDGRVTLDVADSGIGIAAGNLERIFEPFVQADSSTTRTYGGSGLGLSVSRDLARMLGGDITVRSIPGDGSTFTLSLPLG
jgi:signal transduction histidine kinase